MAGQAPRVDIDPFDEEFLRDPYAQHESLREAGALFWIEKLGCYGMARHNEVRAALEDWETFISSRGVGLSDFAKEAPWRPPSLLLETDPPLHDRTRAIMNKIVGLPVLKALEGAWRARAVEVVDALPTAFDGIRDVAEVYPLLVLPDAVGLMDEGREHLLPYAATAFNAFGPRNAIFQRSNEVAKDAIVWVAAACKRENLKPGGWGAAVHEAADRGECSPEEAERLVRSFITAGVDTTVNGIGNMLYAFSCFPEQWSHLSDNPQSTRGAFNESLRWFSTVQTFFRTTSRDVEIEGMTLPEGSKVILFLAAANRDPRRWDSPGKFSLARQASGHVGFGYGIHNCLGQMVARIEADAVLSAMVRRFSRLTSAGEPVRRLNNTLCAFASLPLRAELR